jgi:aspartyl-tRNA(Asn)/glutamyl-tRNA(Gln) amidotransferase subunit A
MNKSDLPFLTVNELSIKIKSKEVSPVEVIEAYLERIEALEPQLHSYITVCGDQAIALAKKAENEIVSGEYLGALHGIPIACKDQWWTKGIRTTGGSTILQNFIPDQDATVMSKIRKSGGILIGKTNLTEFAMAYTYRYPYGIPTNPWDITRMPGGSSAGSASATAAYTCATSLGEDTGGSIRGPAAYCGIVGLRPTQGRVSRYGLLGSSWSQDTIGPMSRTVEDCAITLEAIAGYDPKDKYTWKVPVPNYLEQLNQNIQGLRIGVLKECTYSDNVDVEVQESTLAAINKLDELGARISEISFPDSINARAITSAITYPEGASTHSQLMQNHIRDYDHNMRITLLAGSLIPAQTYYKAQQLRQVVREGFLKLFESVDLIALPTSASPAPKIIDQPGLGSKEAFLEETFAPKKTLTSLSNLTGTPSISIPCGFSSDGLPIGLQLIGRPMDEVTVLKASYAYQQATNWHNRRPPIS